MSAFYPTVDWIQQSPLFNTTRDDIIDNTSYKCASDLLGNFYFVYKTNAGGIVSGQTSPGTSDGRDIILVKMGPTGNTLFVRQTAISGAANEANPSIAVDSSGNIYISCITAGALSGQTEVAGPNNELAIIKLDTNGNVLWIKQDNTITPTTNVGDHPSIAVDNNGFIYVAAVAGAVISGGTYIGNFDVVLIKLSADTGVRQWLTSGNTISSTGSEDIPQITVSGQYLYMLYRSANTSSIMGGAAPIGGGNDLVISKFNLSDGARVWIKSGVLISTNLSDNDIGLAADQNENVYISYSTGGTGAVSGGTAVGSNDAVVLKLDANGDRQWVHQNATTSTTGTDAWGPKIAVDYLGDVYIAYTTNGSNLPGAGDFDLQSGKIISAFHRQGQDIVIAKISGATGTRVWATQRTIFNTTTTETYPFISIVPGTKKIQVVYQTAGTVTGGTNLQKPVPDAIMCQFDANGNRTAVLQGATFNTTGIESSVCTRVDSAGNMYVAYITTGGAVSGGGTTSNSDVVIAKFNSSRVLQWARQSNTISTPQTESQLSIAIDGTQNVFVAFTSSGTPSGGATILGGTDIILVKLNSAGNRLWTLTAAQNTLINTSGNQDRPQLETDGTGNVYLTYRSTNAISGGQVTGGVDIVVMKLDTNGNRLWATQNNTINTTTDDGSTERGPRIAVDTASGAVYLTYVVGYGGVILGGTKVSNYDSVLIKLNSNGAREWAIQNNNINGAGWNSPSALCLDTSGNVYLTTTVQSTPTGGSFTGTQYSTTDITVMKFNSSGVRQWIIQNNTLNTTAPDSISEITSDTTGNVYVAYRTTGTTLGNTRPDSGDYMGLETDLVIAKISWDGVIAWVKQNGTFNTNEPETSQAIAVSGDGTRIFLAFQGYPLDGAAQTLVNSNDMVAMQLTEHELPTQPYNLTLSNVSNSSLTLQWTIDNLGTAPLANYYLEMDRKYASKGSASIPSNIILPASITSLGSNQYSTVIPLYGDGDYTLSLWASNGSAPGPTSALISFVVNTDEPSAPLNLTASGRDNTLFLTWDHPATGFAANYIVTLTDGITPQTRTVASPFTSFTGLTNGVQYTATIAVANSVYPSGATATATVSYTIAASPACTAAIEWVKQDLSLNTSLSDATSSYSMNAMGTDSDGNVYITYSTGGLVSGEVAGAGWSDSVLAKISPTGERLWAVQRAISSNNTDSVNALTVDSANNIIVAYVANNPGIISGGTATGAADMIIVKVDSNGNVLWTKQDASMNTPANEADISITTDRENSIYLTYSTYGTVSGGMVNRGQNDSVILKLDLNGNRIFMKQDYEINDGNYQSSSNICVDDSLNIYTLLRTNSAVSGGTAGLGSDDMVLLKYNQYGRRIWVADNTLTSTTSQEQGRQSMAVDKGGNIYITYETNNGVVSGGVAPSGGQEIILQKFDTNGNRIWVNNSNIINTSATDRNQMLDIDEDGNVYLVYSTNGNVAGLEVSKGGYDIIVMKFDTNGNRIWSINNNRINSNTTDEQPFIAVHSKNEIYIAFRTSGAVSGMTNAGGAQLDVVVAKIGQYFVPEAPTALSATTTDTSITVSFTAPADGGSAITNYAYSINGGAFTLLNQTAATPFTINGLTNGQIYTIQLEAINAIGDSPVATLAVPINGFTPIAKPSLVVSGNGGLTLTWVAPSAVGYTITDYELVDEADVVTTVSAADGTSKLFTNLGAVSKNYRVRAKDSGANVVGALSPATNNVLTYFLAAPVLNAFERSHMELELTWSAPYVQGPSPTITYTLLDGNDNVLQAASSSPRNIVLNTGLTAGQTYTYKIRAAANGLTTVSAPQSAVVPFVPVPVPDSPQVVPEQATIIWNNVQSQVQGGVFQGYKIYYRKDGFAEYVTSLIAPTTTSVALDGGFGTLTINQTSATFVGLTNGALYKYRIVSVVKIDGVDVDSESTDIIRAIPIAPTISVTNLTTVLSTTVAENDAAAAAATVNQLISSTQGLTTATTSLTTMAAGTTTEKAAAGAVFVGLPTVGAVAILQAILAAPSSDAAPLLQGAITANPTQVGSTISALNTFDDRKAAIVAATAAVVNTSTSIATAAASSGIITDAVVAKAVGASDIAARITVETLKTESTSATTAVITNFSQAITDIKATTSTQKAAIVEGVADEILKQAVAIKADVAPETTVAQKTAAVSNALVAVLKEANADDSLKNTLISTVTDNFAGESIPIVGDAKIQLLASIPVERIDTTKLDASAPITIVVPLNNVIDISTNLANQFLAMELDVAYTFKDKDNAEATPLTGTYKQDATIGRYLDFGSSGTLPLGGSVTLFGRKFFMAAAANGVVTPATKPGAPTGVSAVAGNAQAVVSFTAPTNDGGDTITSYTVISSPGGLTASGASSPITITGLTNNTFYTFTVTATNSVGTSDPSAASSPAVLPKLVAMAWGQMGQTLLGEGADDRFGADVVFSADGTIMAVGGPLNSGSALNGGHVRVFRYVNNTWSQIGQDIDGLVIRELMGYSVDLSSDGNVLAVYTKVYPNHGVRIYRNINDTWVQVGQDISGAVEQGLTTIFIPSGTATVSLNSDGTIFAFGGPAYDDGANTDAGIARVFQNVNGTWTQMGQSMYGAATTDYAGFSVSLSSNGLILAVSSTQNDTSASNAGYVRIYEYINNSWSLIGAPITGERTNIRTGWNIDLNADGSIIAIGDQTNNDGFTSAGQVRVYKNISGTWTKIGQDINGTFANYNMRMVSLNTDGTLLATGGVGGGVQVYQYNNSTNTWVAYGNRFVNQLGDSYGGNTVSIAANALIVAAGAAGALANGYAAVYTYKECTTPDKPSITSVVAKSQSADVYVSTSNTGGADITAYTVTSSPGGFTASGLTMPLTVSGLTNGTSYTFTAIATNLIGSSIQSDSTAPVVPNTSKPTQPIISSVSRVGSVGGSIRVVFSSYNGGLTISNYTVSTTDGLHSATVTTSPATISGLTDGTEYTFIVTATNSAGTSAPSVPSAAIVPYPSPAAPGALTAIKGNNKVTLTFATPANNGKPITGYDVNHEVLSTVPSANTIVSESGGIVSIVVNGLQNGIPNRFNVQAKNAYTVGGFSSTSNYVTSGPIAPLPPTNISAVAGHGRATISFTLSSDDGGASITSYTATSSPGGITATGTSSPIIVTGLTNGTSYTFTVTATNNIGTSVSSVATSVAVTPTTPAIPVPIPTLPTLGNGQAAIGWNNVIPLVQQGTFKGYKIYYRKSGETEYVTSLLSETTTITLQNSLGALSFDGTTATITGLTNGILYEFRIVVVVEIDGINIDGVSSSSIGCIPIAPTVTAAALAESLTTAATNNVAAAVNAVSTLITNNSTSTVTESLTTLATSSTATDKAAAGEIFAGLSTANGAAVLQSALSTTGAADILQQAITVNPTQVGNTISALSTDAARQAAVSAAVASVTSPTNSIIAAAATTGIITDAVVAKAVGASDMATRITVEILKTTTEAATTTVITNFSQAITDIKATTSTQKAAIVEGVADEILKQAVAIKADVAPTTTTAQKTAAVSNALVAVLKEANADDNLKNTLVSTIADNFAGESIAIAGDARTQLIASIPAERIDSSKLNNAAPITVVVPLNNVIEISTNIPNQFLAMELDVVYTFKNKDNTSATPLIGTYKQTQTGGRELDFGSGYKVQLGGIITLFDTSFFMASAAGATVNPATKPDAPTGVSAVAGNAQAIVSFTAPVNSGSDVITGYTVISSPGGLTGTGANTPITVLGLTNGTAYTFTVTATNSVGTSTPSTASSSSVTPTAPPPPATAPAPPTINSVVAGNGQVTVSFTAGANGGAAITSYMVTSNPGGITKTGTSSPLIVTGLTNGTSYTFTVTASNSVGTSTPSAASQGATPEGSSEPPPVLPPGGTPSLAHIPVQVNFEVEISGNSALSIFGSVFEQPSNVIVADIKLPVNALYDDADKKGLIEFWEPIDDQENIYAQLANTDSLTDGGDNLINAYKVTMKQLAKGLARVLCGEFNCIAAQPFNDSKYSSKVEYTTQRDFGRVALGAFAHYMFGHVDATAAITNDVSFVKNMLSLTNDAAGNAAAVAETGGDAARYAAYKHKTEIETVELASWTNATGSAADANLAKRLVAEIVKKGLNTDGTLKSSAVTNQLSAADKKKELAYIVSQVVGQDGTRLMNRDNSQRTKNVHQLLRFYENDIIYVSITLNTPQVTVGLGQATALTAGKFESSYSPKKYTLKITLGPKEVL